MNSLIDAINAQRLNNKSYGVIKNWQQPTPSNKYFDGIKDNVEEMLGRYSIKNFYGPNAENPNKEIEIFLRNAREAYPDKEYQLYVLSSPIFRNIAPERPGTTLHKDPFSIIHWQCRGATLWRLGLHAESQGHEITESGGHIWNSKWIETPETFILEPGDVVWFNKGVWHETENLTEKSSIVFDAGIMEETD